MPFPFYGEEFTFTQPDGAQIKVRGWGNQNYAVFETLDGFTVVKDPISGFYQYTTISDDGQDFVPTGVRPGLVDPKRLKLGPRAFALRGLLRKPEQQQSRRCRR